MSQEPDPRTPPPLSADQATMLLGMEATKRRRIATAQQSGSRLVTIGLVLGVCTAAVGGFGVLRLFAAWQLARR
jgi:hypothetical protein